MNEVIYMKASIVNMMGFPGTVDTIVEKKMFGNDEEAKVYLNSLLQEFRLKYPNENSQKGAFWAFWTEDEQEFCEACDDDLQTYHGILWIRDGAPVREF